jgi:hypothetical protein
VGRLAGLQSQSAALQHVVSRRVDLAAFLDGDLSASDHDVSAARHQKPPPYDREIPSVGLAASEKRCERRWGILGETRGTVGNGAASPISVSAAVFAGFIVFSRRCVERRSLINSQALYRLSYRGIGNGIIISRPAGLT